MCGNLTQPSLPPSTANSPPGGGPGALPGLPGPMGVNGFGPLTAQTNGQPGSDTLYNNGLSPYPGGPPHPTLAASPLNAVGLRDEGWQSPDSREGILPLSLHPPLSPSLSLAPAHLPSLWAWPVSPQPRAPAWLTPCSRPTLGCTTTQVSLGAARPGGMMGLERNREIMGGLGSLPRTLPSHPNHAQPLNNFSWGKSYGGLG